MVAAVARIPTMALQRRPLRRAHASDARRAHEELVADDFDFLLGWDPSEPWADFAVPLR